MQDVPSIDRRQFAKQLSTVSGVVAIALAASLNQASAAEREPEQQPDGKPEAAKPVSQELLLLNLLVQRYPSEHFDEVALRGIVADLRGDIARGRVLSEFGLKNSDEPSSVFRAYRGPE